MKTISLECEFTEADIKAYRGNRIMDSSRCLGATAISRAARQRFGSKLVGHISVGIYTGTRWDKYGVVRGHFEIPRRAVKAISARLGKGNKNAAIKPFKFRIRKFPVLPGEI